jgi:hypothetical protein
MTAQCFRRIFFGFSLLFAIGFASLPAKAQGKPSGAGDTIQTISDAVANLTARLTTLETKVSKLEGNISCDDIVGTYHYAGLQVELAGAPDFFPASVSAYTHTGTLTIAADGTVSYSVSEDGTSLHQGSPWFLTPFTSSESGAINLPCNSSDISNGIINVDDTNGPITLYVAAGGRVIIITSGARAPNLVIMTRLK